MQVFNGSYSPPSVAPALVVLPIGGAGRCVISENGVIFEGCRASVSLKSAALALGVGACVALAVWLVGFGWDVEEILGAGACAMLAAGAASVQRFHRGKPVRYVVAFDGVESVAPYEGSTRTLLIKVPGIKRKAAIFFRPEGSVEAFISAVERYSASVAGRCG